MTKRAKSWAPDLGEMGAVKSTTGEYGMSWVYQDNDPLIKGANLNEPQTYVKVPVDTAGNLVKHTSGRYEFVLFGPYLWKNVYNRKIFHAEIYPLPC